MSGLGEGEAEWVDTNGRLRLETGRVARNFCGAGRFNHVCKALSLANSANNSWDLNMLNNHSVRTISFALLFGLMFSAGLNAQPPGSGGRGDRKMVAEFDKDGDGILNAEERKAAREELSKNPPRRRGPRGGRRFEPGKPGQRISADDVKSYPDTTLYDPNTLRTLFLEFENDDWEQELAVFKPTDVEVPAKLTVDGKVYPNVGVSFRGASSFFMIPDGLKRSLNVSMDLADKDQRLYGYKSLNLLNCMGDASMMSSVLCSYLASQRIPTPKVNYVKVVINGESWGIYTNCEQFNKDFVKEHFGTSKGARWKVPGSPRGDGGLRYLGEEIQPYRQRFEIKSKDSEQSWRELINLCRVLNETPADQLADALDGLLNIDGALWFLAVDIVTCNSDGYWTRASDYSIYRHPDGMFHIIPHDMNEAFRGARRRRGGPPRGGDAKSKQPPRDQKGAKAPPRDRPPRGDTAKGRPPRPPRAGGFGRGGVELDPLIGLDDPGKPLRSKLLANEKFRTRYLQHVRTIAEDLLTWDNLKPRVGTIRKLIERDVAADTRKLMTIDAFRAATSNSLPDDPQSSNLRSFVAKRSAYLLAHPAIKALPDELVELSQTQRPSTDQKR